MTDIQFASSSPSIELITSKADGTVLINKQLENRLQELIEASVTKALEEFIVKLLVSREEI